MGESALIRRVSFPAVHRYWVAAWSPERNREVFGATTESHAHTFQVEVEVVGPPDPVTGLVLDLSQLDDQILQSFLRKEKGVAPGQQDIPDFCMFLNVFQTDLHLS